MKNYVDYDELEKIILDDLINESPSDLIDLSTHTYIDSVEDISIIAEEIELNVATISGRGIINIELQYNSDRDVRNGDGLEMSANFNFEFVLKIDINTKQLIKSNYNIDTEKFYS